MKSKKYHKSTKKVSVMLLLVVLLSAAPQVQVMATESYLNPEDKLITNDYTITPFSEEFEYHFATDAQGRKWYRVWSLTFGYWKTDWILIG